MIVTMLPGGRRKRAAPVAGSTTKDGQQVSMQISATAAEAIGLTSGSTSPATMHPAPSPAATTADPRRCFRWPRAMTHNASGNTNAARVQCAAG